VGSRSQFSPDIRNKKTELPVAPRSVWQEIPQANGAPADLVLRKKDMSTCDKNVGDGPGPRGSVGRMRLRSPPAHSAKPMRRLDPNRGAYHPTAEAMNMPYGLCARDNRPIVANSRHIGFDLNDPHSDASATRLAGQFDFTLKSDNPWAPAVGDILCRPYGVAACASTLAIADSCNNRAPLWEAAP
jgi:hypothetical protein